MAKVSKEFWDDLLWSEEHYSELMEKFPDKWVAIVEFQKENVNYQ